MKTDPFALVVGKYPLLVNIVVVPHVEGDGGGGCVVEWVLSGGHEVCEASLVSIFLEVFISNVAVEIIVVWGARCSAQVDLCFVGLDQRELSNQG